MRLLCLFALLCLLCGSASARSLLFRNVNVIPMDTDHVLSAQDVLIVDGVISKIGPHSTSQTSADVIVDAKGQYLIPGLCDMHTHSHFGDEQQLLLYIANGITTIIDLNGSPLQLEWRKKIAAGQLLGPTMYVAGKILDGDPTSTEHEYVKTAADAERLVAQQSKDGYDFVKPYSSLSPEAYNAIMAAARKYRIASSSTSPARLASSRSSKLTLTQSRTSKNSIATSSIAASLRPPPNPTPRAFLLWPSWSATTTSGSSQL